VVVVMQPAGVLKKNYHALSLPSNPERIKAKCREDKVALRRQQRSNRDDAMGSRYCGFLVVLCIGHNPLEKCKLRR
jgi:hypothetical protein